MKKPRNIIILVPFLLLACAKESLNDINKNDQQAKRLLAERFSKLRIEGSPEVVFDDGKKSLREFIDRRKRSELIFLRDSTWSGSTGRSTFYESDEMVVTPSNRSYIYPGSILKASSIANDEFEPLYGYKSAPIRVHLSFPSSLSIGTIDDPSLSESRVFLRNAIMSPDFSGNYVDDFRQTISHFSKYNEVKLAYGYNVNERRLFSSTNSSFDYSSSGTHYATKLMVSYIVKNFTYSMSDPVEGELIDLSTLAPDAFGGISPVFINSVTYGRFGLLVVETQNSASQMKSTFEKVIKKIFKQTSETFTKEEKSLFQSSRVTVYLLGSTMGESVIQLLINPDPEALSGFIGENVGTFNSSDPGVPIYFTAKYLKDNSRFKTIFKLDFPS